MTSKHFAAALLVSSALVLTGCKNKPKKAKGPDLVTEAWIKKNIGVDGAATEVSEADAQKALEFLELDAPGEKVSWEARTGSNGNYVYKNITSTEDNFTVDSLTIKGLRMLDDETPVADSFEVTNLSGAPEEGVSIQLDSMKFVLPGSENMLEIFDKMGDGDIQQLQSLFKSGEANISVGGGYVDGFTVKSDEVNFNIDFAGWAEDEETRKMSLLVKNWKGDIDENGGDLDFSLDTLSLKGFDLEYYDAALGGDIAKMNPFEPNIESLSAKNFSIKVDGLNLDMPKLDAWYSEKKNGKFSTYTTMPSFKMTFDSEPDDKDIKEMKEALSKLGYGEVEFSMNSEGHMDETRDFVDLEKFDLTMKDGFSLTMDYEMTGVKKMTQAFAQFGDPLTGVSANTPPPDMEKLFKEAFTDLKLHHFEIGFDDKSILEKAFNFAAKEQGVGVDLIRQQAKGGVMMATIAVKSEYQSELAADFAENMTKLVDEGGSFKMVMKPDENLNIGQVLEDYTKNEEARMKSIMGQIDDETDTEIIAPEPFDTDAVLRRLGIDFQHSAN